MDAMTKLVVHEYAPQQFLMVRYWGFVILALIWANRTIGIKAAFKSARPGLQFLRSIILIVEAATMAIAFAYLGLAEAHAIFAVYPLLTVVLAALVLREPIGWRRRAAIAVGFLGALLIIKPGMGVFQTAALIPLAGAALFASYAILTRFMAGEDRFEVSFCYMAVMGALAVTPLGLLSWRPPTLEAAGVIGLMAVLGIAGHVLLVKALEYANASALQPFNFFLLAWATMIGMSVFGERPDLLTIVGTIVIVAAGLFTIFRERAIKTE